MRSEPQLQLRVSRHPLAGGPLKAPLLGAQRTAASAACESPSPCGWSWRAAPEGLPRLAGLRARDKSQKSQHGKGRKPLRHGSAVPPPLAGEALTCLAPIASCACLGLNRLQRMNRIECHFCAETYKKMLQNRSL